MTQKKNYNPEINPTTGDYVIENGNMVRDESLQFPAHARMKIQAGTWLYAPDDDYGSNFGIVKKRTNRSTPLLQNVAERALQPLIDDGRAVSVQVEATASNTRHDANLTVTVVDRNQQPLRLD